jgi:hypothetical protein
VAVKKLSLRRGELLMLLSDGADVSEDIALSPDGPLDTMAEQILARSGDKEEDDATVALIRLRPAGLPTS